ncbi:MAG: hypothetical protein LBS50_02265 [Prevotellaceae bacterium]|jgi:hypothetical protein|nr:hypothetical protein [Prevotellaceae bacterium]
MNNNKILKKVVIIFTAIIMACPIIKAQTAEKLLTEVQEEYRNDTNVVVKSVSITKTAIATEQPASADYDINLNFNFSNNEATFYKALKILGIGFSIVFVVMIIFIFVCTGIDKAFPYKAEE